MKRIMLAALAAAIAAAPASALADRRYTVTSFDRIQVEGPFAVSVVTGKASSARAVGSPQATDRVSIEVQGRTLKIRPNKSAWGGYPGEGAGPVEIELTTHELRGATVLGSGSLGIDKAKAMHFDIAVSGSGRVEVGAMEADDLVLDLLGSGKISLGGRARTLRATIQGSGDLDAAELKAEDAQIAADTSGSINLGVRRSAKIESTGHGDTVIVGSPACTVETRGFGRVSCGKD
jgi:hypothetical protein